MKKAFDCVELKNINEALRHYGIDDGLISLVQMSYSNQMGTMDGHHFFDITR